MYDAGSAESSKYNFDRLTVSRDSKYAMLAVQYAYNLINEIYT